MSLLFGQSTRFLVSNPLKVLSCIVSNWNISFNACTEAINNKCFIIRKFAKNPDIVDFKILEENQCTCETLIIKMSLHV